MTKGTTMVTNNVFRSTKLFGKGSSHMILFSLQLMTLRSYMTNHTTMVASWNKLRSIQNLSLRPKWRLWFNSLSLHLLVSFMWRNVHQFFHWGRTHNRHKIGYHNVKLWFTNMYYVGFYSVPNLIVILFNFLYPVFIVGFNCKGCVWERECVWRLKQIEDWRVFVDSLWLSIPRNDACALHMTGMRRVRTGWR